MQAQRFVSIGDETVLDTQTGLMWASRDSDETIDWDDARKYCSDCRVGGHADWRLPTLDEFKSICDPNYAQGNKAWPSLIRITNAFLWAADEKPDGVAAFNFSFCRSRWYSKWEAGSSQVTWNMDHGVLPVRSIGSGECNKD